MRNHERIPTCFYAVRRLPYRSKLEVSIDVITRQGLQHQFLVEEVIVRVITRPEADQAGEQREYARGYHVDVRPTDHALNRPP